MIAQREQLAEHAGRATEARVRERGARGGLARVEAFDAFLREPSARGARNGERRVVRVRAPKRVARVARCDRAKAADRRRTPERADLLRGVASVQNERLLDWGDARD